MEPIDIGLIVSGGLLVMVILGMRVAFAAGLAGMVGLIWIFWAKKNYGMDDFSWALTVATKTAGMASWPGVMTPTECFAALKAGADGLKIFPASLLGPEGIKAIRAVLPKGTLIYAVGGAGADNFGECMAASADGFGIGSALYKQGFSVADVKARAIDMVAAYNAAKS